MTDDRQSRPCRDMNAAASDVAGPEPAPGEPGADNETSAIGSNDRVVALLDLISVELLEMVECFLSAELVDRLIELYDAVGLHDLAQDFTDELDQAIPEVDWDLS